MCSPVLGQPAPSASGPKELSTDYGSGLYHRQTVFSLTGRCFLARPWPNSPSYRDRPAARPGLTTIVQRAQALASASGAAIALTRREGEEIECCVRSGRTAPPLGKSILAQDSLAALCIRSGQQLWCHDVETDPRMRGAALFDPSIRSLVFTPLSQGDKAIGVLAVFADAIDAFSAKHLLQLEATIITFGQNCYR